MDFCYSYKHYPFKFNHRWVGDEDFQRLIRGHWRRGGTGGHYSAMEAPSENLIYMKEIMKRWERQNKRNQRMELLATEEKIMHLFTNHEDGIFTEMELEELRELEHENLLILSREEAKWRLKSRELWIKCGDQWHFLQSMGFLHHMTHPK